MQVPVSAIPAKEQAELLVVDVTARGTIRILKIVPHVLSVVGLALLDATYVEVQDVDKQCKNKK